MINPVEAKHLVDEINKSKYKLNRWERNFVTTIERLIEDGRYLSENRSKSLQQIYRKSAAILSLQNKRTEGGGGNNA